MSFKFNAPSFKLKTAVVIQSSLDPQGSRDRSKAAQTGV
jgi:hypothetical protein